MRNKLIKKGTIFASIIILISICISFGAIKARNVKNNSKSNFSIINKKFVIYDGIMHSRPDLTKFGLKNINIIYEDSLLDAGVINFKKMDRAISRVSRNNDPICLDIESWDLRDEKYKINAKKYIEVLKYFKMRLPKRKIGYFGMLPYRDLLLYQEKLTPNNLSKNSYLEKWGRMNDHISYFTKTQDIAFPSFYTRNKNMELWNWVKEQQISKLKALDPSIPVYGFMWPQYWNSEFLSGSDWAYQLESLYKICDGVVIWSPPFNSDDRKTIKWDSGRAWWKETLKFIRRHNIN
ncbi:hypothetical protein [Sphingobacterium sp. 2149]|uniref:hypothetical protein n=1 Tax=Sphingobacterium sp. 2149 TaxID=2817763 RepID=UPI0028628ADC|nr:hypothetical protein [Sphingobacterium sp. 2149]MDR6733828.1 hypothetical protein [Sphingobacterium sp. 2149]